MLGNNVLGILFSYVHDERVRSLTQNRVMASIPFGGRYRLVDFALSNMVNAGVNNVGIITQQNYLSLMDHLGSGKAWGLSRKNEGLKLLPPYGAEHSRTEGKIETLASVERFLRNAMEDYVLLGDCDLIANIDFRQVFDYHTEQKADITLLYCRGTSPDTDKNITYTIDPEGVVREAFIRRGSDPACNYGLGTYLISRAKLLSLIEDCMSRNLYDFERDIIQRMLPELRVCAYELLGLSYQVVNFETYFYANMALMDPKVRQHLFNVRRPIYTKERDDMPTRYGLGAAVKNSIVADGCIIEGEVENCVLFRGVTVKPGAKLKNCVIMQDTTVGENTSLNYVITDKNVVFGNGKNMMGHNTYPVFVVKGSVV